MTPLVFTRSNVTCLLLASFISVVWLGGVVVGMTGDAADPPEMAFLPEVVIIGKRTLAQHEGRAALGQVAIKQTDTDVAATTQ